MSEFLASMYQITRDGRHVTAGEFRTAEEVFECVRCQRAGVYCVHRQEPSTRGVGGLVFWGEVAHFGAGKIAFDPEPVHG